MFDPSGAMPVAADASAGRRCRRTGSHPEARSIFKVIASSPGCRRRYFNSDSVMVRIGFAVSVLFGGVGIVAYAILALFFVPPTASQIKPSISAVAYRRP